MDQESTTLEIEATNSVKPAKVIRSIMVKLMPIIFLMVFANYIDRSNLSYASFRVREDLHLSPSQYGIVAGIFYVPYLIFQIPSNLIITKVRTTVWLGALTFVWGLSALSTSFVINYHTILLVRILLGISESGLFPGLWFYEMKFFPNEYSNFPTALMDLAQIISQVCSAPIAIAIMKMDGKGGWQGWRWLFLFEGVVPVLLAFFVWFVLPEHPRQIKGLSSTEREWLQNKIDEQNKELLQQTNSLQEYTEVQGSLKDETSKSSISNISNSISRNISNKLSNQPRYQNLSGADLEVQDRKLKTQNSINVGIYSLWKKIWKLLCSGQMWVYLVVHFSRNIVWHGLMYWLPTMISRILEDTESEEEREIAHIGHLENRQAILLTTIPYITGSIGLCVNTYISYKVGRRKPFVMYPFFSAAVVFCVAAFTVNNNLWASVALVSLGVMFVFAGYALCVPLVMSILEEHMRGIGLAYYNTLGNVGGLLGPIIIGFIIDKTHSYVWVLIVLGFTALIGGIAGIFIKEMLHNSKSSGYQRLDNTLDDDNQQNINRDNQENSNVYKVDDDSQDISQGSNGNKGTEVKNNQDKPDLPKDASNIKDEDVYIKDSEKLIQEKNIQMSDL